MAALKVWHGRMVVKIFKPLGVERVRRTAWEDARQTTDAGGHAFDNRGVFADRREQTPV